MAQVKERKPSEQLERAGGRPPGGAARGAKEFPGWDSRKFNYYQPKGRRATLYEDVTVDVLPDPSRHLLQGWILEFADGMQAYDSRRTKLKSSDWHAYRAPDQEWERNHYQRQNDVETMIKQVVERARLSKAPQRFDKMWRTMLQDHLGALKHAEYGLGRAMMSAQRDGVTQMINNSLLTNAAYKLRLSQDLVLYLAEIAQDIDIDLDAGKKHWVEDPAWQGTRKLIETILSHPDYLEQYFAVNIVCEPLVTELLRSGLFMQFAAAHGDFVTPAVLSAAETDYDRNQADAVELFNVLANDEKHQSENKKTMQKWLKTYVPLAHEASQQLQPLWSQPRVKRIQFADIYEEGKQRLTTALEEINVELPKGVTL